MNVPPWSFVSTQSSGIEVFHTVLQLPLPILCRTTFILED